MDTQDPQVQSQIQHIVAIMMPMILIFSLIIYAIIIIPLWRIASRAGLSGALSLLTLIPGIGLLIALYVIAFMQWKVVPAPTQYTGMTPYPPAAPPSYPPSGYPPQGPTA